LLSRTNAGDAELRTPQNGLSLGQRKLLTFLEQPQALEEFAARHDLPRDKLDRDLAKLASLNLLAIDGMTSGPEVSTVVLGGSRGPTALMRYGLVPLLLVGAAIVYYVLVPAGAGRKPNAASPIAGTPAAPAAWAAAGSTAAPESPASLASAGSPAPLLAVGVDVAPRARDVGPAHTAENAPVRPTVATTREPAMNRDTTPISMRADATHGPAAGDVASRDVARAALMPVAATASASAPSTASAPQPAPASSVPSVTAASARAEVARPVTQPTDAVAGVAAPAMTGKSAVAPAAGAAANPPPAAPARPQPTPVAEAPAEPATPARPAAAEAVKLAMAAPGGADARPPAPTKLLPISREDPEFPREAISRGVADGTVKALLAIDAAGKVTGVRIVDARPARVFDRAVKDALVHWTFPAGDAGRSTEVEIAFRRN
jgi:protein TonB